ncbi:MAG: DUF4242 domain-containing protein [Paracoccaceae bacterium]
MLFSQLAQTNQEELEMKRFMIERDIPGVGEFSLTELCGAARASNQALVAIGPTIQWQHSYVAGEKTFCVYLAEGEEEIEKHAELSGIPITRVTEISQIIDPLTANN